MELTSHPHPIWQAVGSIETLDQAFELLGEALEHGKITGRRLFITIAATEWAISATERGIDLGERTISPPATPAEGGIRAHFMYWRMYCRSIAWPLASHYGDFLEASVAGFGDLPPKVQTEWLALLRRWAQHDAAHAERARALTPALLAASTRFLSGDTDARQHFDGEWLHQLLGCFAVLDRAAFSDAIGKLSADPTVRVDEVDRWIEGARSAGWRREFAQEPAYTTLHERLAAAPDDGTHATARAEWVRGALDHARKGSQVLALDGRTERAFVDSARFSACSATAASAARDADGVVDLLEIALETVSDDRIDLVVAGLQDATSFPDAERVRMLRESGNGAALTQGLVTLEAGDEGDAEAATKMHIDHAARGERLRRAASAIVRLEGVRAWTLRRARGARGCDRGLQAEPTGARRHGQRLRGRGAAAYPAAARPEPHEGREPLGLRDARRPPHHVPRRGGGARRGRHRPRRVGERAHDRRRRGPLGRRGDAHPARAARARSEAARVARDREEGDAARQRGVADHHRPPRRLRALFRARRSPRRRAHGGGSRAGRGAPERLRAARAAVRDPSALDRGAG